MTSTRSPKVLVLGHSFLRWLSLTLRTILILALPRLLTSRGMFMFIYMASAVARSSSWLAMTWASLPIFSQTLPFLKLEVMIWLFRASRLWVLILIILFVCFVVPSQLKSSAFARLYLAGARLSTRLGIQKENWYQECLPDYPIRPQDYSLLGICWKGLFYYDRAMPMGCARPLVPLVPQLNDCPMQIAHSLHFASLGWLF